MCRKQELALKNHVVLKSSRSGIRLNLDPNCPFPELLDELEKRFSENARFWGNIQMTLQLEGRKLTDKEEREIIASITEHSGIDILCVLENDPEQMEHSEQTLRNKLMEREMNSGHFCRGTLSCGETLESGASIVVLGDVKRGARVTAKGNIVILGGLYGTACAGISGKTDVFIAALDMNPQELRIASCAQNYSGTRAVSERDFTVAYLVNCKISTKKTANFLTYNERNLKNKLEKWIQMMYYKNNI
jgi:septum site-determining protein MinC